MFSRACLGVETRYSATGVLGKRAAVALMTGCEAFPTKYRGPSGRDMKCEWNVPLGALPGLGLGFNWGQTTINFLITIWNYTISLAVVN